LSPKEDQSKTKSLVTPLSIIAGFVGLIEIVAGYSATQTSGAIQWAFVLFMVGLALIIVLAFFAILWFRPYVLYPPSDYASPQVTEFVQAMQLQQSIITTNKTREPSYPAIEQAPPKNQDEAKGEVADQTDSSTVTHQTAENLASSSSQVSVEAHDQPSAIEERQVEQSLMSRLMSTVAAKNFAQADLLFAEWQGLVTKREEQVEQEGFYYLIRYSNGDTQALNKLRELSSQVAEEPALYAFVQQIIGEAFEWANDFRSAKAAYDAAIEAATEEAPKATNLVSSARCLFLSGDKPGAYQAIMSALLRFSNPNARLSLYQGLASLYEREEEYELKAIALEKALELQPNNTAIRFDAAYAYGQETLRPISVLHYETLLAFDANHAAALNNIGVGYDRLDMSIHAVSGYKKSIAQSYSLANANLAYLYLRAGFVDEAERVLQDVRNHDDVHENVSAALAAIPSARQAEVEALKKIRLAARAQQGFLSCFADAYFAYTTELPQLSGDWSIVEGDYSGSEVTIEQKGKGIKLHWQSQNTEYVIKAELFNRGALIVKYETVAQYFPTTLSDHGYLYSTPETDTICVLTFLNDIHSTMTLRKA
jgi:tetratricopeptide (TPR) repeat protein